MRRELGGLINLNWATDHSKYCVTAEIFEKFRRHTKHETPNAATNEYLDTVEAKNVCVIKNIRKI